jgi:hypothetical protein
VRIGLKIVDVRYVPNALRQSAEIRFAGLNAVSGIVGNARYGRLSLRSSATATPAATCAASCSASCCSGSARRCAGRRSCAPSTAATASGARLGSLALRIPIGSRRTAGGLRGSSTTLGGSRNREQGQAGDHGRRREHRMQLSLQGETSSNQKKIKILRPVARIPRQAENLLGAGGNYIIGVDIHYHLSR